MTRVDEAYELIRNRIMENILPAGFQASEPEFSQQLGMSRTPVREALIRLQSEGLIERIPRRGLRVLPVSLEDMAEIYRIFTIVEPEMAADIAAQGYSAKQLNPLESAVRGMEKSLEKGDLDAWAQADKSFHQRLLGLQSNSRLRDYMNRLHAQIHRARMLTVHLRTSHLWATQEIRKIQDAIASGDGDLARQLFRARWERVASELIEILNKIRVNQF